jgi:uncharacterized protein (TIGR00251 family)
MSRLRVRLTPRASRDAIDGWHDGVLHARVAAAPVDGAANEALVRLLAKAVGVPKSRIAIIAGTTSREKTLEIMDMDEHSVMAALGASPPALGRPLTASGEGDTG